MCLVQNRKLHTLSLNPATKYIINNNKISNNNQNLLIHILYRIQIFLQNKRHGIWLLSNHLEILHGVAVLTGLKKYIK